ncbi:hypothetical protein E2C01_051059 [Portunus trituberculatus]|uniref:Uncharacterized protein n=1 Tax=Portunus trituberculatus TaxID=210409 RepID=A0A5B7GIJ3_PORTR|nr:hypothetical protein [Portunus trituberculatus]
MRFGDGGNDVGGIGGLMAGQWSVDPDTGLIRLTEAAMAKLINPDPIEKWYLLDPEPLARQVRLCGLQTPRQVHVLACVAYVKFGQVHVSPSGAATPCYRCARGTCV